MFGGLAFLIGGNMAVAASGQGGLLVRVDPAESDALVATTNARLMEMRGRRMQGGCGSTRKMFALSVTSPSGWNSARLMRVRCPRSDSCPEHPRDGCRPGARGEDPDARRRRPGGTARARPDGRWAGRARQRGARGDCERQRRERPVRLPLGSGLPKSRASASHPSRPRPFLKATRAARRTPLTTGVAPPVPRRSSREHRCHRIGRTPDRGRDR